MQLNTPLNQPFIGEIEGEKIKLNIMTKEIFESTQVSVNTMVVYQGKEYGFAWVDWDEGLIGYYDHDGELKVCRYENAEYKQPQTVV